MKTVQPTLINDAVRFTNEEITRIHDLLEYYEEEGYNTEIWVDTNEEGVFKNTVLFYSRFSDAKFQIFITKNKHYLDDECVEIGEKAIIDELVQICSKRDIHKIIVQNAQRNAHFVFCERNGFKPDIMASAKDTGFISFDCSLEF